MFFEWDEAKNQINIRKHGIDFSDVPDMFNHPMLIRRDSCVEWRGTLGQPWLVEVTDRRGRLHGTAR